MQDCGDGIVSENIPSSAPNVTFVLKLLSFCAGVLSVLCIIMDKIQDLIIIQVIICFILLCLINVSSVQISMSLNKGVTPYPPPYTTYNSPVHLFNILIMKAGHYQHTQTT